MAYEITPEMEAQRIKKNEVVTEIYTGDLDMLSIDEAIETFNRIKKEYGSKGHLRLDLDYSDYKTIKVLLSRPETDEELRTRVDADSEAQRVREVMEKNQLKRLLDKYGVPKE